MSEPNPAKTATATCLCGAVAIEITVPAFWAWHDHTKASRLAHGAAYATYVGCWKKNVRIARGGASIARFADKAGNAARCFCRHCGTPLMYERGRAPRMVNIPRALFTARTGREARYHIGIAEMREWTYTGAKLAPLKNYPGVMWERPSRRKPALPPEFEPG
jgi:hypothetical protein